MSDLHSQQMSCMQVWGGSQPMARSVEMRGLDAWVYSKPYAQASGGGDIYFASSCATGRINRLLLADVCGHGDAVAETATQLRGLMGKYINFLDQTEFVRSMNHQFVSLSPAGCFATAVVTTFFAPTRRMTVCNAGHPRPLWYRRSKRQWIVLKEQSVDLSAPAIVPESEPHNIPLGLIDQTAYEQIDVEMDVGDLLLCYTDALTESHGPDGSMLCEEGLVRVLQSLGEVEPADLIQRLVAAIGAMHQRNLCEDDTTVLLLRPTGLAVQAQLGDRIRGITRLLGSIVRAILPGAARPSWPELSVPNIGGAILPKLGRRWRAPPAPASSASSAESPAE